MKSIEEILRERFAVAMGLAFGMEAVVDPLIKAGDPKFADYQSNVAMALGKKLGRPPREVAQQIVRHLEVDDLCEPITEKHIAGPGFINIRLKQEWIGAALQALAAEPRDRYRAGVEKSTAPQTIVVDYSAPNVAKQMHVGHLRSTIIGDTLARTLEFLGHDVVRQNHLGDFGTQFGMLIHHLRDKGLTAGAFNIADLDRWYKEATERFAADKDFAVRARKTVVELQSGDAGAVEIWNRMRAATRAHYTQVYEMLGVTLEERHVRGESFYGPRLPVMMERIRKTLEYGGEGATAASHDGAAPRAWEKPDTDDLPAVDVAEIRGALDSADAVRRAEDTARPAPVTKAFAAVSDGALCVFLPGYVDRDGKPLPLMLQKSDGGYPYSATDMAGLYFRVQEEKRTPEERAPLEKDWHAARVIYLTDARQSQHFAMLFDAFRAAQWDRLADDQTAALEHAFFGSILGEDRKPYKTRKGNSVALIGFLEDAIEAAQHEVDAKNAELPVEKRQKIARAVGLAAVKYADLRNDRTTDYVFNPEQMVAFDGNTGPYLQYAFTRVRSIFRKAGMTPAQTAGAALKLEAPEEVALAKALLKLPGVLESVARDLKPHYLCTYLYDLAKAYSVFYEACPVVQAPDEATKKSRLLLCDVVARTLELGLTRLLGIETLEEM